MRYHLRGVTQYKLRLGGRTLFLHPGQYEIGRMPDCWLTLDDDLVSRYHARLLVSQDGVVLEDLGSRNGTFVNGERLEGRRQLSDGDKVRIGREILVLIGGDDATHEDVEADLRRTLAPGEDAQFPVLIAQLFHKSLRVGRIKEAERYAEALARQIAAVEIPADHPTARAFVDCVLALAERTHDGVWIDRLFTIHAKQRWLLSQADLDRVRAALDRIPRVPGTGLRSYERTLRTLGQEAGTVPPELEAAVSELADAYAG
ncbi:MAG: FHA domain-containing protein [Deltaproteobacteria bacterium]|nr:MAG: FHA domain-containing protein [Deltaproteobacteria bacterium]